MRSRKKVNEIEEIVSKALKHTSSIEDFAAYTKELLPYLHQYGDELLKSFYASEDSFLYKLQKKPYVVSYENANDKTIEGLKYTDIPAFTCQFRPDKSKSATGKNSLYEQFCEIMKEVNFNAVK